jgi:hypothetical protein
MPPPTEPYYQLANSERGRDWIMFPVVDNKSRLILDWRQAAGGGELTDSNSYFNPLLLTCLRGLFAKNTERVLAIIKIALIFSSR